MKNFNIHGDWSLEYDKSKNTIVARLEGPFNIEGIRGFHSDLTLLAENISDEKYFSLVILHGDSMLPNFAIEEIANSSSLIPISRISKHAIVCPDLSTIMLDSIQIFWKKVYANIGFEFQLFNDLETAQQWLYLHKL